MRLSRIIATCLVALPLLALPVFAQGARLVRRSVNVDLRATDGYPLDTCVACQKALPAEAQVFKVDGSTVKTDCKECRAKVEAAPQEFVDRVRAARIAVMGPHYPLDRCPISRDPLDAKGEPVAVVAGDTLVKVCCDECKPQVTARASRAARVEVEIRGALAHRTTAPYPVRICPVCDKDLGAQAIWVQHGTELVRLCSAECFAPFQQRPNGYVAKVAEATRKASQPSKKAQDAEPAPTPPTTTGETKTEAKREPGKPAAKKDGPPR